MNVTVIPAKLRGTIAPPPSKSESHRLLIAAALSGGVSTISNVAMSQDIEATLSCLRALGVGVVEREKTVEIHGIGSSIPQRGPFPVLDCGESGSTLRFLIPVALTVTGGAEIRLAGRGRLMERPQQPYFDLFGQKGIYHELTDGVLTVRGELKPGEYALPGNVSSQFFTGLLFALPLLEGDSAIVSTTKLESADYISMTIDAMAKAGVFVSVSADGRTFYVRPARYTAFDAAVEADWSQAAFWYAALALGSRLELQGLNACSAQGDMVVVPHYLRLAQPGDVEIDVSGCPDLVPPLAAMAALRSGTVALTNAGRLRMKESDRLAAVAEVLSALGAEVREEADRLVIVGRDTLSGGVTVSAHNDHRIAMMAAVAATRCERPVTIIGAECVAKSYPTFWEDYEMLGGQLVRSEV